MRRREFIVFLGGAATAWPVAGQAQQPAMPVIGFLNSASPESFGPQLAGFRQGRNEVGYTEGNNVAIEFRWAKSQYDRLPELAADLVRRQVAVIAATGGSVSAIAARSVTTTIPIVFTSGGDPVQLLLSRHTRRREFVTLVGGAAAAWPRTARAQQPAMPVVGFLSDRAPGESMNLVSAFRQGLREVGFVEGQNVIIAFRWAEGHSDRLPTLAKELIDLRVAVLFAAGGSPSAFAAKTATQTIPVVFSAATDPVSVGLVTSLSRPGGNVTGMSFTTPEMVAKSTQLLKELVPGAGIIAYLVG
jgi:ABC-type uncharacterized transport system substrate-binding protein